MLTNHKPSRMAARAAQAAALIGGMGKVFIERRNSAGAYKSGRALRGLRKRICARLQFSLRLFWAAAWGFLPQVVQCVFFPAFQLLLPRTPAARAILTTTLALLLFPGCVAAHKKGRTIHERWYYVNGSLICREMWEDEWTGGGRAFLADPKASELVSIHTNQVALGGYSSLSIGAFQSEVSTNGIIAAGHATGEIVQDAGAAVGQIINKSVTGLPVK